MMTFSFLISLASLLSSANNQEKSQNKAITSIGIYLDIQDYDQSAFALMEQAEEAMEEAFPGIPWQTIDSAGPKALSLPAPLPLLGKLAQAKPDSMTIRMGLAASQAFGYSHLLLVQRGGTRAARDSSQEFGDAATFTLLDAASNSVDFRHALSSVGLRQAKNSAETSWARSAWKGFVNAWKTKPQK